MAQIDGTIPIAIFERPAGSSSSLSQKTEEKMEPLARNILSSQSEVDDIPPKSLIMAIALLHFPKLTTKEVSKAILSAYKITPRNDQNPTAIKCLA